MLMALALCDGINPKASFDWYVLIVWYCIYQRLTKIAFITSLALSIYLGFALISLKHDKLIHFVTFFILTTEFYFIFDTRNKSLKKLRYITFIICTLVSGIALEIVQNLVNPSRVFDLNDIIANILGSLSGLGVTYAYSLVVIKKTRSQKAAQWRQSTLSNADIIERQPEEEVTNSHDMPLRPVSQNA